jgi:hypothetical protein
MTHYAIVEMATGKIVRMHAHYDFGSEQPVACPEEELQAVVAEMGDPADFAVHAVPAHFNPADRDTMLRFDPERQQLEMAARETNTSRKGER